MRGFGVVCYVRAWLKQQFGKILLLLHHPQQTAIPSACLCGVSIENIPFQDLEQPQQGLFLQGTQPGAAECTPCPWGQSCLLCAPTRGLGWLSGLDFLHLDVNLLNILGCLGSPQGQGVKGAARADQQEGPWSVWWQAVKFPAAGWDGHTLFLGSSLLLSVWPKKIVTESLFHLENF